MEIVTYVDFVDPMGHAHKAGLRSGTEHFSFLYFLEFLLRIRTGSQFYHFVKKDALLS